MAWRFLDLLDVPPHGIEDRDILAVVDLALQQPQHFQPMFLRLDEVREQRQ